MVVRMEVRYVDVREVPAHGDDIRDHAVGIAEELGGVDEDGVPFPVQQRGVAVEPQVAVQKDPKFQ